MSNVGIYEVRYNRNKRPRLYKIQETTIKKSVVVNKPEVALDVFETAFSASRQNEEYVYLMCCNSKMNIVGLFIVSHGSVNCALMNIYGIFQRAFLCNSIQIIVAHNHPSGACENINFEDGKMHKKLREACRIMEIELVDNMIIADGNYLSFRESGWFE